MSVRVSNSSSRPYSQRALRAALNTSVNHDDVVFRLSDRLFSAFQTPYSLKLLEALHREDWSTLANAYVDPNDYTDSSAYFLDKQSESLLRKYPFPGTEKAAGEKARETFDSGERVCAETNGILKRWNQGGDCFPPGVDAIIFEAQRKIRSVLGSFSVEEWSERCSFGPGSVTGVAGTSDYSKLSSLPTVTSRLRPFAEALIQRGDAWVSAVTNGGCIPFKMVEIQGGKYSQVPKDAKTNRNIEVQPLMNAFMQSGIGKMIRSRLKKVGINLNDQTRNQRLAREGSLTGFWATMDLSNASDTICSNLVRLLIPYDWLHAMELTRTHEISIDDEWQKLHRFSSMGNGFTFELESLIFWALSKAACEDSGYLGPIAVYGDDIIVPATAFSLVSSVLSSVGFSINAKKSFVSGPFRESCGADWFNGINVRPYFIKENPRDVASLISIANGLRRSSLRASHGYGCTRAFAPAWFVAVRAIPASLRRRIAFGFTATDDFILSGKAKEGFVVQFLPSAERDLNWYPAKATALYRLDRRRGSDYLPTVITRPVICVETQTTSGRPVSLGAQMRVNREQLFGGPLTPDWLPSGRPQQSSDGHITDYRRDCGEWRLRKAGSVILGDPTALWW